MTGGGMSRLIRRMAAVVFFAVAAWAGGESPVPKDAPAASAGAARNPPRFLFFYPQQDKFWEESLRHAQAAASALGARLEAVNFGFNGAAVLERLGGELGRGGVDGIILQPSGVDAEAVFKLAERHGVPVILINADAGAIDYAPRVKHRQWIAKIIPADRQAGALLMEQLAVAARGAGTAGLHVLAVGGLPGDPPSELRRHGMEQYLKYQNDVESLVFLPADWKPERAAAVFREQYRKNPAINVVWAANDNMALSIRREIDALAPPHPVFVGGIDWDAEAVEAVAGGRYTVTVGGHFMEGALAVALLFDYVNGRDFAAEGVSFSTAMPAITAENAALLNRFRQTGPSGLHFERLSKVANPGLGYYSFEILNVIRIILEPASSGSLRMQEADRRWLDEQAGRFVFGVERDYPPFSFVDDDGRHQGLAVDYLGLAETELGVRFERSGPASLDELLAGAREGRIQVLTAVKPNPERLQYLHFTRPFVDVPVVLLTAGAPGSRLEDFKGGTIATARGYAVADFLAREHPEVSLELFGNDYEAMMGVVAGKASAAVVDLATATYLLRQHGLSALKVAGTIDFSYNLCLASTDERMARLLDRALEAVPAAERKRLHDFWFMPSQESRKFRETLSPEEAAWLGRHPALRVVSDGNRGPVEYAGADGEWTGLANEYLDRLGKLLGVRFEHAVPSEEGGKYRDTAGGRADMVACASRATGRQRGLVLTAAYASAPVVLYGRSDASLLSSLSQLQGRTLAVVREGAAAELIGRNHPGIRLLAVASAADGFNRLARGECDAFAETLVVGNYYLAQGGYTGLRVAGGTPYNDEICLATADPMLAAILAKALAAIPAAERDAMARRWFAIRVEQVRDYSLLWKVLLGALGGYVLFALWNRRLHREVVARRRAEAELTASKEKLEAANKELEAFSYSVSHDLRAPLRHVAGFVQLLQEREAGRLDETSAGFLETVAGAARRMGLLIDDLLSFSRTGRAQMKLAAVPLGELVDECRRDLAGELAGRAVEWEVGALPEVTGDRALLKQVFANLLGNAVKYTRPRNPARISVSAVREAGGVVVTVRDNGVGFDMRFADKLFGVFQRLHTEAEFEGTGIGLANVRRIIARHGGRAWAEGEPGKGAAFHFSLPVAGGQEGGGHG